VTDPDPTRAFAAVVHEAIRTCIGLGYRPTYFMRMVDEQGPVSAARSLITASTTSEGFTRLYELGRLDLTVESIALRPEFASLFTVRELSAARARLNQFHQA
jgi:hypothetical protein